MANSPQPLGILAMTLDGQDARATAPRVTHFPTSFVGIFPREREAILDGKFRIQDGPPDRFVIAQRSTAILAVTLDGQDARARKATGETPVAFSPPCDTLPHIAYRQVWKRS